MKNVLFFVISFGCGWLGFSTLRAESSPEMDTMRSLRSQLLEKVTGTNSAPTALKLSWKYRINALSLALRYPDTEMAHAVYECVCKDESDMKWEREREARRDVEIRGSENWKRLNEDCKRHFDQFLSSSRQRWTTGLFPVVAPYILSDAKFYTPKGVVEVEDPKDTIVDRVEDEQLLKFYDVCVGGFLKDQSLDLRKTNDKLLYIGKLSRPCFGKDSYCVRVDGAGCVTSAWLFVEATGNDDFHALTDRMISTLKTEYLGSDCKFFKSQEECNSTKSCSYSAFLGLKYELYELKVTESFFVVNNGLYRCLRFSVSLFSRKTRTCPGRDEERVSPLPTPLPKSVESKISAWARKNLKSVDLTQYNAPLQVEYRDKLEKVRKLVSTVGVLYMKKERTRLNECSRLIASFYNQRRDWSVLDGEICNKFDNLFDKVLKIVDDIIVDNGDEYGLRERRDKLWLTCVCHVNTWEELRAKIEAEKERERKLKEEREYRLRERSVRAEEEKNAILNDIRRAIDDLPR